MALLCKALEVSRSGFYSWQNRTKRPLKLDQVKLEAKTKEIFKKSGKTYGSRRISGALMAEDFDISRHKARTLMKNLDLRVRTAKKYRVTTNSKHKYPVASNLLNRQFNVPGPNIAWVTDITYIWTNEGWLYLAAVIDLYSRRVVGWSLKKRMTTDLALEALRMAWWSRKPGKGLIHHSDRGSQYASNEYQRELEKFGMICSMSRKGNCWDNAVAERFFRSLKSERVDFKNYRTRDEATMDIINYIVMFYNSYRLHSYLGYQSPVAHEKQNLAKAA